MKEALITILTDILKLEREELLAGIDEKSIWDSLHRVEVLFAVEDEFDISFDEDELKNLDTPKKLIDAVLSKAE